MQARSVFAVLLTALALVACEKKSEQFTPANDPSLAAARQEARDKWPQFVDAFAKRKPGAYFIVDINYDEGGTTESVTLNVTKATATDVTGTVQNYPQKVSITHEQEVTVPLDALVNWMYETPQGDTEGDFVGKALKARGGG